MQHLHLVSKFDCIYNQYRKSQNKLDRITANGYYLVSHSARQYWQQQRRDRDKKRLAFSHFISLALYFFCYSLLCFLFLSQFGRVFDFWLFCLYFIAPFNHSTDIENSLFFYCASVTIFISLYERLSLGLILSQEHIWNFIWLYRNLTSCFLLDVLYRKAFHTIFPLLSRLVLHFSTLFFCCFLPDVSFYLYLSSTARPKLALCNNQRKIGFWKMYLLLSFLDVRSQFVIYQTKNVHTFCS